MARIGARRQFFRNLPGGWRAWLCWPRSVCVGGTVGSAVFLGLCRCQPRFHPGYIGASVGFLAGPVVLGSRWALAPISPIVLFILWRTAAEDRFLRAELPGYASYAERVRYGVVPGIW